MAFLYYDPRQMATRRAKWTSWKNWSRYFLTDNTGILSQIGNTSDGSLYVYCPNWEGYWWAWSFPVAQANIIVAEITFSVSKITGGDPLLWFCIGSPSKSFGNSGIGFPYGGWSKLWIITRNFGGHNYFVATGSYSQISLRTQYNAKLVISNKRAKLYVNGSLVFSDVDLSPVWSSLGSYLALELRRIEAVIYDFRVTIS